MNNCAVKFVNLWTKGINKIISKSRRADILSIEYLPKIKHKTFAKTVGLRSMQNIIGVEREIIEGYRNELSHDVWGNPEKLKEWAINKFNLLRNKNYVSEKLSDNVVKSDRNDVVKEWAALIDENFSCKNKPFLKLKILKSIVENLKENNAQLPPVINKNIFEKSVNEVNKFGFSFKKTYHRLFRNLVSVQGLKIDETSVNGISGRWYSIKMPDYAESVNNYGKCKKVKELLTILSYGSNWCTRSHKSINDMFLGNDFHIFVDNKGYPQICLVGTDKHGGKFRYIKGNNQYANIPEKYKAVLKEFLEKNNLEKSVVGEVDSELKPTLEIFG